ncbi:MAG: hypothetical protein NTNFB02_34250 [Nitrospira sp.]
MKHRRHRPQQEDSRQFSKATSEHFLHVDHMQPSIELVTDLMESTNLCEAGGGMKRNAGRLLGVDARNHRVMADRVRADDQVGQQGTADAFALVVVVNID